MRVIFAYSPLAFRTTDVLRYAVSTITSEIGYVLEKFSYFSPKFIGASTDNEEKHFYRFKSFQLDVDERQLLHDGNFVSLTPKAFDVLAVLVERSGHLVEKEKLLLEVWVDSFVEEANIT